MTAPLLIVNADDYGLTAGTSAAIRQAHEVGIVTSTSVLVLAPGAVATAPLLADQPTLGVGVHLALVGEDPPLCPAAEIPTLVDRRGGLAASWRTLLPRLAAGRVDPGDVRRELGAQLDQAEAWGLAVDHVDTHQHLHLWPAVAAVVVALAVERGIGSVRVPRSAGRGPKGRALGRLGSRLAAAGAAGGLATTEGSAGLDEAGRLTADRLVATLDGLGHRARADGWAAAELGCHPGADRDPDRARYRWGYAWAGELAALTDPSAREAVARAGFRLGTWAQLAQERLGPGGTR